MSEWLPNNYSWDRDKYWCIECGEFFHTNTENERHYCFSCRNDQTRQQVIDFDALDNEGDAP